MSNFAEDVEKFKGRLMSFINIETKELLSKHGAKPRRIIIDTIDVATLDEPHKYIYGPIVLEFKQ